MSDNATAAGVDGAIQADAVIVGAGPCGLFQIFELGLLGIRAHIIDSLKHPGGQCSELYPEKPIYDIPALPVCGAQELVDRLLQQAKPFNAQFHLGQEVTELKVLPDHTFLLRTSLDTRFHAKTVIIAGGLGSFQPRRLGCEGVDAFENTSIHYKVKNSSEFTDKHLLIFGGGDSALDWTLGTGAARRAASRSFIVVRTFARRPCRSRRCTTSSAQEACATWKRSRSRSSLTAANSKACV